jgi:hypothetical protein
MGAKRRKKKKKKKKKLQYSYFPLMLLFIRNLVNRASFP